MYSPTQEFVVSRIVSSFTQEFIMSLGKYMSFFHSLPSLIFLNRFLLSMVTGWYMCVNCVICVCIHNSMHTCHDMHPSLMHCFLVMMHRARKVSMFMAAVASMIANSEYDKQ